MEQPLLHCPHCGADLEIGSVLHAGRFSYSTHGGFRTDGTLLKSGGAVHIVLGQIMAGRGMLVTEEGTPSDDRDQGHIPLQRCRGATIEG